MRVALMTAGSRGDVAPYTGLAHRLAGGGHSVTVVTHASFAKLVAASGAGFHPLPVDPRAELESARGRGLHRSRTGAGKLARVIALARAVVGRMADGLVESARDSDVLLLSASLAPLGHAVARELGLPSMGVYLQPLAPTRAFAPPVTGTRSWGGPVNLLAGHAVNHAVDRVFAEATRTAVRGLLSGAAQGPSADAPSPASTRGHGRARAAVRTGYRARERQGWRVHHGFSPLVVPRPGDWRAGLTVDGYWWPHDPPGARLPDRLRAFLDAGPPPVFVGLGSATVPDPAGLSALLVRALRAAGLRGVVQRGWGGLRAGGAGAGGCEGQDMLTVDEVPHALLFPRTAAVVHHAGAGTTAAGLRAGVPAVPVPIQFDEAFWASRLTALGVSPGAIPLRRLGERALTDALVEATRCPSYRERAAEVAARLRAEDGAGAVLASVDRLAEG